MKKLTFLYLPIFIIFIFQCTDTKNKTEDIEIIQGNNNIINSNLGVYTDYDKIIVDDVVNVKLHTDDLDSKTIKVKTDANLVEYLELKVTNQTLYINVIEGIELRTSTMQFDISTYKDLQLQNNGSTDVEFINSFENLEINNEGSGNITMNTVFDIDIKQNGSGDILLGTFISSCIINSSGSGNVDIKNNSHSVEVTNSGSGNITFGGQLSFTDFNNSGSGNISALNANTPSCNIINQGPGECLIDLSDSGNLNVNISGSGDVKYKGHNIIINQVNSGSGKLISIH